MRKSIVYLRDILEKIRIHRAKGREIKKFENSQRKEIWSKVVLDESQKKEIDDLYIKNYGKKIPHTWHRHYTAFMDSFDSKYFPELLYIPEFERFMNANYEYGKVFEDKNVLPMIAKFAKVKMPKTIISSSEGIYFDKDHNEITIDDVCNYISNMKELFGKPSVDSWSGQGCILLNFDNGIDTKTNKNVKHILKSLGKNFVLQEKIVCHDDLKKIYPDSVNTFRIITYRWKDGYHHMPIVLRIGRGGNYVDNAHSGGIFVGVEDDGSLKNKAFTEFNNQFLKHPDTGLVFEGYKISGVDKVIEKAYEMHRAIPQIGVVNWDFTLDEDGEAILIEANIKGGGVWIIEMAHGKGPFGDLTGDVLKWIGKMERVKPSQYKDYLFGN